MKQKGQGMLTCPFRRLLISNSGTGLERLLSGMGINLKKVSFTRIEGIIAYRIGDKTPDSPKLLLEKETFLPSSFNVQTFSENPPGRWPQYASRTIENRMDRGIPLISPIPWATDFRGALHYSNLSAQCHDKWITSSNYRG